MGLRILTGSGAPRSLEPTTILLPEEAKREHDVTRAQEELEPRKGHHMTRVVTARAPNLKKRESRKETP